LKFKLFGREFEIKSSTSALPKIRGDDGWAAALGGRGYPVSANTALKVSAVIRCCDVVATTLASLPLNLYQETEKGKEKAVKHPLYKLLYRLPNPETTSFEFWHMYIFNLMLTSGAYAKIVRDRGGFIRQLWNIPTAAVTSQRNSNTGERYIMVSLDNGKTEVLYPGQYMYTPGLRFGSGDDPEDPIKIASDVLGLTMALNGFAKDFFENGSNLGGFIEYDGMVSDEAYERFKESWNKTYAGVTNQHKWAFLESGFKVNTLTKNPVDSQALESRKFEINEICRLFGVPPHKVFDLERATFSNIEQQNMEYVQEAIVPRAVRIEQTIYKDLLLPSEQGIFYAKFAVNGLLRGDTATRTAYYSAMRQNGIMSANEIRELEDMNRIPTEAGGDVYCINGAMIPLTSVPQNLPKGALKAGKE
jgi:HK97 family phage portal protein